MKQHKVYFAISISCLLAIGIMAFKDAEQKKYQVSYTQEEWNARYTWILASKQMLEQSNLPINQVKPLSDSLTKFTNELAMQLLPQFPKPDTSQIKK